MKHTNSFSFIRRDINLEPMHQPSILGSLLFAHFLFGLQISFDTQSVPAKLHSLNQIVPALHCAIVIIAIAAWSFLEQPEICGCGSRILALPAGYPAGLNAQTLFRYTLQWFGMGRDLAEQRFWDKKQNKRDRKSRPELVVMCQAMVEDDGNNWAMWVSPRADGKIVVDALVLRRRNTI
ncbi:hypothetical protein CC86DRAFT_378378 [Ophiobolus disseminans]|uniref:Uncharacterized protein n=1 Tax=Ophiobolus disseminans TaxID=1469910 RepID=A0A6A7AG43_9PLEO|nr:hypothetical protein CC86DRAFT_378378 [Ophiobolus disseminans]